MTTEEAYDQLGLSPVAVFAQQHGQGDRQRGASTFMLVQAALCLFRGLDVIIVGRMTRSAEIQATLAIDYAWILGPRVSVHQRKIGADAWELDNGAKIRWMGDAHYAKGGAKGTTASVFVDKESNELLDNYLRDQQGPFGLIMVIRAEWAFGEGEGEGEPHYNAYDGDGGFVLELTKEGAEHFAAINNILVVDSYL